MFGGCLGGMTGVEFLVGRRSLGAVAYSSYPAGEIEDATLVSGHHESPTIPFFLSLAVRTTTSMYTMHVHSASPYRRACCTPAYGPTLIWLPYRPWWTSSLLRCTAQAICIQTNILRWSFPTLWRTGFVLEIFKLDKNWCSGTSRHDLMLLVPLLLGI
ncbi:hypothetical protein CYLTODRAFT_120322 [Cylindrobasidium torrendii FP15055 ss-10]|uniref:Uncharacterized protein n=1 Tax=Cylindrobasidium torrendii FP15055 ss-10 TaxID=1314674 RepID=A0A0D7B0B4_9AGAR|nr:hypothetical protein CYLTODRAFT_120322 [Cylindrobasidium torrendii FP15055 ss-10]